MSQTTLTILMAIAAAVFLVLWIVERFGGWQREHEAVSAVTRELRIALRFIALRDPVMPGMFAECILLRQERRLAQNFPAYRQFREAQIEAEAEESREADYAGA